MSRAVHRLHTESLVLRGSDENVFFVIEIMSRGLPELEVVQVR
jgi:hypothetical protein